MIICAAILLMAAAVDNAAEARVIYVNRRNVGAPQPLESNILTAPTKGCPDGQRRDPKGRCRRSM